MNHLSRIHRAALRQPLIAFIILGVLVQLVFRLWFVQDHNFFHAEQVRDYAIIQTAHEQREWILLGPVQANTGGIQLGPFYYYFFGAGLLLGGFHPVAGTLFIAAVWLAGWALGVWYLARYTSTRVAALFGMLIALNQTLFLFSSFPLNPNILLPMLLLLVIGVIEFGRSQRWSWMLLAGFALGGLLQLHLACLALLPALGLMLLYKRYRTWKWICALVPIVLVFVPVIISELQTRGDQLRKWKNFLLGTAPKDDLVSSVVHANPFINSLMVWLSSTFVYHGRLPLFGERWFVVVVGAGLLLLAACGINWVAKRYTRFTTHLTTVRAWFSTRPEAALLLSITAWVFLATVAIHTAVARHYLLIVWAPLLLLALLLSNSWKRRKVFVLCILAGYTLIQAYGFMVDLRPVPAALNAPRESFTTEFNEQWELAELITAELDSNKLYRIYTSEVSPDLEYVMDYLIDAHMDFDAPLSNDGEHASAKHILYIGHKTQLPDTAPLVTTEHFTATMLTRKEWRQLLPALSSKAVVDLGINSEQLIARMGGGLNGVPQTRSLEAVRESINERGVTLIEVPLDVEPTKKKLTPVTLDTLLQLIGDYPTVRFLIAADALLPALKPLQNEITTEQITTQIIPVIETEDEYKQVVATNEWTHILLNVPEVTAESSAVAHKLATENDVIWAVAVPQSQYSQDLVTAMRGIEKEVFVKTVNTPTALESVLTNGATGIFTDFIGLSQ